MFEVDHLAVQIFSFDLADAHTHALTAGPFFVSIAKNTIKTRKGSSFPGNRDFYACRSNSRKNR